MIATIVPIFLAVGLFSVFWACLVSLCLLAHFIDDSADPGGIAWLAPFVRAKFCLPGTPAGGPMKRQDWLRGYYLRPTVKSIGAVILSLLATYLTVLLLLQE